MASVTIEKINRVKCHRCTAVGERNVTNDLENRDNPPPWWGFVQIESVGVVGSRQIVTLCPTCLDELTDVIKPTTKIVR